MWGAFFVVSCYDKSRLEIKIGVTMQTLTASGLSKAYGDKQLFSNIDFLINEGDRIGLIGVNGTGKTTLLNGLAGIDPFDAGELSMPKNYQIRYLAQQPSLPSDSLIMDAIYGGSSPILRRFANMKQHLLPIRLIQWIKQPLPRMRRRMRP